VALTSLIYYCLADQPGGGKPGMWCQMPRQVGGRQDGVDRTTVVIEKPVNKPVRSHTTVVSGDILPNSRVLLTQLFARR
jgi:hypothetical protein